MYSFRIFIININRGKLSLIIDYYNVLGASQYIKCHPHSFQDYCTLLQQHNTLTLSSVIGNVKFTFNKFMSSGNSPCNYRTNGCTIQSLLWMALPPQLPLCDNISFTYTHAYIAPDANFHNHNHPSDTPWHPPFLHIPLQVLTIHSSLTLPDWLQEV